jgi:hypothetical protein
MKEVAILLLLTLVLNGCSTSNTVNTQTAQTAAGGIWSAELIGGSGEASGFSFTTQFTVEGNGGLSITYFQLLTAGTCFPTNGGVQTGQMALTINGSTNAVTGTLTYTVTAQGNTLTLTGNVTGTESGTTLTGGSVTGTWNVSGGTGCTNSGGTFTMTQKS